jgi:hypothetical protein
MTELPVPKLSRFDALLRKCGFKAAERLAALVLMSQCDPESGQVDFALEDARKRLDLGSIRRTLDKLRDNGLAVRLRRGRHLNDNSTWDFGPLLRCKPDLPPQRPRSAKATKKKVSIPLTPAMRERLLTARARKVAPAAAAPSQPAPAVVPAKPKIKVVLRTPRR